MGNDTAEANAKSWRRIWTFIVLVMVLTLLVSYILVTRSGIPGRLKPALIMWVPGVSALAVKLVFDRTVTGLGLSRSGGAWLLLALLLPLVYALPVYLPVWHFGLGGFNPGRWRSGLPYVGNAGGAGAALGLLIALGLPLGLVRALGEEIGWRGFLIPELLKHMSLAKAGVLSGLIWTTYHMPLIIFGSYNSGSHGGPPLAYQIGCFSVMVTSMAVFFAWVRVRSQSAWPCALLHASHNLWIQAVFDRATVKGPSTAYVIGEFGFGLALTCLAVALGVLAIHREKSKADRARPRPASLILGNNE